MNFGETLRKLFRRWYILLAGLLLAVGASAGVWSTVPAQYERVSTQLLIPGSASLPPGAVNPLLYVGGVSLAADVVVRATGSENIARELEEKHPGVTFLVSRDPTTPGPVVLITVRANTDQEAGAVLDRLMEHAVTVIDELQEAENIPVDARITVVTTTKADQGTIHSRTRLILSAGAGLFIAASAVLLAALVEGLAGWRRRRRAVRAEASPAEGLSPSSEDEPPEGITADTAGSSFGARRSKPEPEEDPMPLVYSRRH